MHRLRALPSIHNLLVLVLLGLAGVAAESFQPGGVTVGIWRLAIVAGVLGIVLGLLRTPDSLSHLVAIGTAFAIAITLAALRLAGEAPGSSFIERLDAIGDDLWNWYLGVGSQGDTNELLIGILLQMIAWLGGYLAAWSLARQGWVAIALFLPGASVFAARVGGFDTPPYLLEIYIVVAVMLLARTTYLRRTGTLLVSDTAERRGWASMLVATVVGILVVSLGLATPDDLSSTTIQPVAEYAGEAYVEAQDRTADWLAENLGMSGAGVPDIDDYPRYTAFDDAFSIGGDLNLSDQPEVLVRVEGAAPYLTAQSYDRYTGRGWESSVEETFEEDGPDGVRYAPELTFRPQQEVPYSPVVTGGRRDLTMEITPLGPPGDTMFASGQYVTADVRASVRMSWRQLDDARFPLRDIEPGALPRDLLGIASMLAGAEDMTVEGDSGLLYPASAEARDRLQAARAQLSDRFIDVGWTVGPDGTADEMIVTGQVPVYDDNVAVERTGEVGVNDEYLVTSGMSVATEDELRAASGEYPDWVTQRYLALPDGVTARTVALARQITAGTTSPFDQAKLVEAFLRQHIQYDLDVGVPKAGTDIVDYVLFELRRGYCEHYASAMTVMLRILGIPAKTVVGYFPGEYDAERGGYLYRQENAHAWTEAFFPGYGWIRFEPTASQPAATFEEPPPTPATATPAVTPTPVPETPASTPAPSTPETIDPEEAPIADVVEETPSDDGGGPSWTAVALVAAALAVAGGIALWWAMTRSPSLEPRALYSGLMRWGRAGGVRSDETVTPREYAGQVGRRYPQLAGDADQIVDVYEDQRYGGKPPARSSLTQAADALRRFQRAIVRRFVRLGR